MTITYTYGDDPAYGFAQILDLLATGIYGGSILQQDGNTYSIQSGGKTYTFIGTDFTYGNVSGQTLLFGGTISGIAVAQGSTSLAELTNVNVSAANLTSAFLNEFFGFDPLALENLFLTQDWVFEGNDDVQILTSSQTSDDGVPFPPSGNDLAYLYDGDDIFDLGAGNDTLYGGSDRDKLYGNVGDDSVYGGNGRDYVYGGAGNDIVAGDGSQDRIYGGSGEDSLYGGSSADRLYGSSGADLIYGGSSNDRLYGGTGGGTDTLYGGTGNDKVYGGNQRDKLYGDSGTDSLYGGVGNDYMYGGTGADKLYGGADADRIYGGDGDDTFYGGTSADQLYGGDGADHFEFKDNSSNDVIHDYDVSEGDTARIAETSFVNIAVLTDHVDVTHSGGTITFEGLTFNNLAEYNAFSASLTVEII